jgi:hypothetical protein
MVFRGAKKGRAERALEFSARGSDRSAADEQVVDDPDDRQHEQQVDQGAADVNREPEQP